MKKLAMIAAGVCVIGILVFIFLFSKPTAIRRANILIEDFPAEMTYDRTSLRFLDHSPFIAWVSEYYFVPRFYGPPLTVKLDLFGRPLDREHWTDYYYVKEQIESQRIEQGGAGQPVKRSELIDSPD